MGCIPMNLEISYHLWCQGYLSSLSSTFILTNHLHVGANFIMKAWEQKYHHSTKFWEDPTIAKLRQLVKILLFSKCGWWDRFRPSIQVYKTCKNLENTHVRIWFFKFGAHMPLLEGVKFYWLDDGCLTYWTWMPSLEHVCFGMLPKLLT